jgi:hypothetical protein
LSLLAVLKLKTLFHDTIKERVDEHIMSFMHVILAPYGELCLITSPPSEHSSKKRDEMLDLGIPSVLTQKLTGNCLLFLFFIETRKKKSFS